MGESSASPIASEKAYWTRLYEQCYQLVYAHFARNVRCQHDVEDLVQEVFANLIARGGRLDAPLVYVRIVVRHQLYAYWRRKKRAPRVVEHPEWAYENRWSADAPHHNGGGDPLLRLAEAEMQQRVMALMGTLSPGCAEVLRLRFIMGLGPKEAAARAGCSHEAMKKRLTRAKRSLEELCEGHRGDRVTPCTAAQELKVS